MPFLQNVIRKYWVAEILNNGNISKIRIYAETKTAAQLIAHQYGEVLSLDEIEHEGKAV